MLPLTYVQRVFKYSVNRTFSNSAKNIRVRFAPSPTGYLHLGGLRTALYNYLFAKAHNGTFILRIEDTDQSRVVQGAIEQLQKDLTWAGIKVDEGPLSEGAAGPYIQSQRLNIYQTHLQHLLDTRTAYHCFCTDKRLELLRKAALKAREIPKYDNRCRNLSTEEVQQRLAKGEKSCIRFKLIAGPETFVDLVFGTVIHDVSTSEGDPVIIKTDGYPTYHFANVVDDHSMGITHVLRGVEWQISTTKHILMYKAFNWIPPKFGHLPLLMNSDGTKLSKRQGDIQIDQYRQNGIFPLALLNFITYSGGGFEKDGERHLKPKCYTLDELTQQFDVSRINLHSSKLMPERLLEFNRLDLKQQLHHPTQENLLVDQIQTIVKKKFPNNNLQISPEHIRDILRWSTDRITKLTDLVADDLKFIWVYPDSYHLHGDEVMQIKLFIESFNKDGSVDKTEINRFLRRFCETHKIKFGTFMKTLRSILSGLKDGPSVAEMIDILGTQNTKKRLELCLRNK